MAKQNKIADFQSTLELAEALVLESGVFYVFPSIALRKMKDHYRDTMSPDQRERLNKVIRETMKLEAQDNEKKGVTRENMNRLYDKKPPTICSHCGHIER